MAQLRWNDLHVTRQHDGFGTMTLDNLRHLPKGLALVLLRHRYMVEGNAVPLHHAAQVLMVGYDTGNLAGEVTALPAVQNIGETVGGVAGHYHHPLQLAVVPQGPAHPELLSQRRELIPKCVKAHTE